MERFCSKCGTLVSGQGQFCPSCGAAMESAVDLGKPVSSMPEATSAPVAPAPAPAPSYQQPQYQQPQYQQPQYQQAPQYPQYTNVNNTEMTVGQWVGTIFLSGLGLIGVILLFVWAFSADTPISKKNYSKALLIWYAIGVGLYILFLIIIAIMGVGLSDIYSRY